MERAKRSQPGCGLTVPGDHNENKKESLWQLFPLVLPRSAAFTARLTTEPEESNSDESETSIRLGRGSWGKGEEGKLGLNT